ncbi:hypothetical protein Dimus_008542, partial [Dionaea muscipula]
IGYLDGRRRWIMMASGRWSAGVGWCGKEWSGVMGDLAGVLLSVMMDAAGTAWAGAGLFLAMPASAEVLGWWAGV